jgi:hypothetical protein
MTDGQFSRAKFIIAGGAGALLAACSAGGVGVGLGQKRASTVKHAESLRIRLRSERRKVAFPRPRPDGSTPPLNRPNAGRHTSSIYNPVSRGGDGGGGTGGGSNPSGSVSGGGYVSDAYGSSNYVETYDSNGDLCGQIFGSDSGGYSLDVVDSDGTQFTMDMTVYPGDPLGEAYSYAVEDGAITVAFGGDITNRPRLRTRTSKVISTQRRRCQ